MKKSLICVIAIAIAMGLVISSASSMPTEKKTTENDEIIAHFMPVQCKSLDTDSFESSKQPMTFAGIQVTTGENDEFHPSIAGAPGGGFYAMAESSEDGVIWHPVLYGSGDGEIWEPLVEFLYDNAEYTDMDQNSHGTYGTFGAAPDSSGQIIVVQGEIEDGWVWDFGAHGINEFSNNRIDCYTFEGPEGDPGTWNWGGLSLTGYNGFGSNDIEGCPFIFYQYSEAGGGIIGWLTGDVSGCEHTAGAMDLATNKHYAVHDRDTGEGNYDLLIRKDDFGAWTYNSGGDYWTHDYQTSYRVTDTANLMYPSAAAYNDNVIVACQKDSDVVVFYSSNGFSTYSEVLVQDAASYPEVSMAAGGIVVITYIKDDILYMRTSDSGGATWSDAEVVSDNQVNLNDRAANLDEFGGDVYCIWEDTRGDSIDCYYDLIYENPNDPPDAPTINGPPGGKPGKQLSYEFTSIDPNGDDIRYFVDWGDGNTEWSDYASSGTAVTLTHTWEAEGAYTITANGEDINGLAGPASTKPINIPRGKSVVNSIFIQFLQQYPNAFPILRQLLGL